MAAAKGDGSKYLTLPGINDLGFREEANFKTLQELHASGDEFFALEGWTNGCNLHTSKGTYYLSFISPFGGVISKKRFQSKYKGILEQVEFPQREQILSYLEDYKRRYTSDPTFQYDDCGHELTCDEFHDKISGLSDDIKMRAWAEKKRCADACIKRIKHFKKAAIQREKERLEKEKREKAEEERQKKEKERQKAGEEERRLQLREEQKNDAILAALNGLMRLMDSRSR